MKRALSGILSLAVLVGIQVEVARAHGIVGKRFFPATLAIEDPAVADELALPSVSHIKRRDGKETAIGVDFQKRITPNLGITIGSEYRILDPAEPEERSVSGFANPDVGLKYTVFKSDPSEAILSLGFAWEVGGVGKKAVGAESFSTLVPALFFGKGLGDLPDGLAFLRPLALTGTVGAEVPLKSSESDILTYGLAIQYSLPYLQSYVKDVGLPAPLNRMIPLVELVFETPLEGERTGKTTGTVNPGIIWAGKFFEVGLEAIIPLNTRTGRNVGVRALLHFFLDDLYPAVFRPIFQ